MPDAPRIPYLDKVVHFGFYFGYTVLFIVSFGKETQAIKTVSDLFMPVSGEVIAFNEPLIRKPEVVNTDPYGEGWMIQIAMSAPEEWDTLLTAEEYRQLIDA